MIKEQLIQRLTQISWRRKIKQDFKFLFSFHF
jgi:hypothetical protein